jgi:hypothetical protein
VALKNRNDRGSRTEAGTFDQSLAPSVPQLREASADWTDLGAGPMLLQAIEGEIKFAVADLKPAASAITFSLGPEHGPQDANTMSRVRGDRHRGVRPW